MRERWAALKLWQKVIRIYGFLAGIAFLGLFVALAFASRRATSAPATGSDVVVAIVGGTLLALALNRPRINWRSGLDARAIRQRELGLTVFGFFSAGYAFAALYDILQGHLPQTTIHQILPAAFLMFVYLLIIHHEPFIQAGRLRGWCYAGIATGTGFVGFVLADVASGKSAAGDIWTLVIGFVLFVVSLRAFLQGANHRGAQPPSPCEQAAREP